VRAREATSVAVASAEDAEERTVDNDVLTLQFCVNYGGRAEIVEGWLGRQPWQEGGWTFDWDILMITGDTAAVRGTGIYDKLGTFENLWVLTLDKSGRCTVFRMWNNEI